MKKKLVGLMAVAALASAVVPVFAEDITIEDIKAKTEMSAKELLESMGNKEDHAALDALVASIEEANKNGVDIVLPENKGEVGPNDKGIYNKSNGFTDKVEGFDKYGNKLTTLNLEKSGVKPIEMKKAEPKAVAKADTKTAEKALPKTSAVK